MIGTGGIIAHGMLIMGFAGQDASLFAIGAAVRDLLGVMPSPARAA